MFAITILYYMKHYIRILPEPLQSIFGFIYLQKEAAKRHNNIEIKEKIEEATRTGYELGFKQAFGIGVQEGYALGVKDSIQPKPNRFPPESFN